MANENETQTPSMDDPEYKAELVARASLMGLTIHPNAKPETIAAKIAAKLREEQADAPSKEEVMGEAAAAVAPDPSLPNPGPAKDPKVARELHPAKRLQRVIITCNDPQKADQTGDIISVSNAEVGNMRFYFHFNKPWHVPQIVLNTIKESKLYLHSSRNDGKDIVQREVPRYNIQYLEPLTEKERERIAAKQAAALATED